MALIPLEIKVWINSDTNMDAHSAKLTKPVSFASNFLQADLKVCVIWTIHNNKMGNFKNWVDHWSFIKASCSFLSHFWDISRFTPDLAASEFRSHRQVKVWAIIRIRAGMNNCLDWISMRQRCCVLTRCNLWYMEIGSVKAKQNREIQWLAFRACRSLTEGNSNIWPASWWTLPGWDTEVSQRTEQAGNHMVLLEELAADPLGTWA